MISVAKTRVVIKRSNTGRAGSAVHSRFASADDLLSLALTLVGGLIETDAYVAWCTVGWRAVEGSHMRQLRAE